MQHKKCGRCKKVKDITEFTRVNSAYCRECTNEYHRKYRKYRKTKEVVDKRYYAVYKGDEFVCMGSREECAKYLGVKKHTITFWSSPVHKRRTAHRKAPFLAIVVEED